MNLETSIKDVISKKLEDGTVEKIVEEQLAKGIIKALESLFSSYGDVTKVIEKQVKSVMVPYLETYDYSEYVTKLDSVLVDVLKSSSLENKKLLENFKDLIVAPEEKVIKIDDLFQKYIDYVAKNVETDGLEIDYDDEISYESVKAEYNVEEEEGREWSSFKSAKLFFECEHDENMNFAVRLSKYTGHSNKKGTWDIRYDASPDLKSLRNLNSFEVLLMNLTQTNGELLIEEFWGEDSVRPEKEPEASFS